MPQGTVRADKGGPVLVNRWRMNEEPRDGSGGVRGGVLKDRSSRIRYMEPAEGAAVRMEANQRGRKNTCYTCRRRVAEEGGKI